jgi:proline iminopeptidase
MQPADGHDAVGFEFVDDPENTAGLDAVVHGNPAQEAVPGEIIHGRQDLVCPVENAWTLHRCWPGSRLTVLPRSGHVLTEPELSAAVVLALESLADRLA